MVDIEQVGGTSSCHITCEPSKIIDYHRQVLDIDGILIEMNLITMKRSFLLQIDEITHRSFAPIDKGNKREVVTLDDMIEGFCMSNPSFNGLSLATGSISTCLVESENDVYSKTLASRLSRTLNQSRPVYVANNLKLNQDNIDQSLLIGKIHMKIFDFVRKHYKCPNNLDVGDGDNKIEQ